MVLCRLRSILWAKSSHAFLRKSFGPFAGHSHINHNTSDDESKEDSLLQNTISFLSFGILGIDNWSRWNDWNDGCDSLGGLCWRSSLGLVGDRNFNRFFLTRLELCFTVFNICCAKTDDQHTQHIKFDRKCRKIKRIGHGCSARREVLYSSTWIPSSGTGNSPLLTILTGDFGLSPGPFGTFSMASTIS